MKGYLIRLRLFLKLWFTSFYSLTIMVLIPIVGLVIYNQGSFTVEALSSMIYEKAAPIWLVFILQWCFSIDLDSKFYNQLITYPVTRWGYLMERAFISLTIFFGLAIVVTLPLGFIVGNFLWKGLLFTIPIYLAIGGFVILGTMVGKHSLGGLMAGILFWMAILFGGPLLKDLNAILLPYSSVQPFVSGESTFLEVENHWILYNRLFYVGLAVLFIVGSIFKINRRNG